MTENKRKRGRGWPISFKKGAFIVSLFMEPFGSKQMGARVS